MKNIFDKIILFIFYILCFLAFFYIALELPNIIASIFNKEIENNYSYISFVFCLFILMYSLNIYSNIEHNTELNTRLSHQQELMVVDRIHSFNYTSLNAIKNIIFTGIHLEIILTNNLIISLELIEFVNIENQQSLSIFDSYISKCINDVSIDNSSTFSIQFNLQQKIQNYLRNLE